MATKKTKKRTRRQAPEWRLDVTRLEYQAVLEIAQRNQESIRRLEMEAMTQFRRTVEQQAEIDALKKIVLKK